MQKKLKAKGEEYEKKAESAIKAGALIVQNEAKQTAPYKTGNLRRSIHTETLGSGEKLEAKVGTNVVYAAAQEFGLADRNIPAHPYLRPALDNNRAKIKREIERVMKGEGK